MGEEYEEYVDSLDTCEIYDLMSRLIRIVAGSGLSDGINTTIAIRYIDEFLERILQRHDVLNSEYDIRSVIDNLETIKNNQINEAINSTIRCKQDALTRLLDSNNNDIAWDSLLYV